MTEFERIIDIRGTLSTPVRLLVLLIVAAVPASGADSQDDPLPRFDLSSIESFLAITAVLGEDGTPTEAEWDELFDTTGYRTLRDHEPGYSPRFFKKRFELVFRPSLRDRLEARLSHLEKSRADSWYDGMEYRVLLHYCRVRDSQSELLAHFESLRESTMCRDAYRLAARYLPAGSIEEGADIAFLIFAPDARGYDPILLDLGYIMSHSNAIGLMAHELHHYYLNRLWAFDPDEVDEQDHRILNALGQIYKEGVADQIDKPALHFSERKRGPEEEELAREFRRLVRDTPKLLRTLDGLLAKRAGNPDMRYDLGREFAASIPQSGHPTGFYMARMIAREESGEALIENAGNPFAFVRRFNRAAKKKGAPIIAFSDEAMAEIARLEKKYVVDGYSRIADLGPGDPAIPGIDLRSVDCFFRIVSSLETEKEPTEALWRELFATYGYHNLIRDEGDQFGRDHHFKRYLRLVFHPSAREKLESELPALRERDRTRWRNVMHLCRVRDNRQSLLEYVEILRSPLTREKAMQEAARFLPEHLSKERPGVCFVVFSYDTRGLGNDDQPALVDLLLARQSPLGPEKFIARWFWYNLAARSAPYDLDEIDNQDRGVLGHLSNVYIEGIANLIGESYSVMFIPSKAEERESRYQEHLAAAPEALADLDALLAALGNDSVDRQAIGRRFSAAIPGKGGELGLYMAKKIIELCGSEALREVSGNPIAFFRVFGEAATKGGIAERGFSDETMSVLLSLEKRYCQGG